MPLGGPSHSLALSCVQRRVREPVGSYPPSSNTRRRRQKMRHKVAPSVYDGESHSAGARGEVEGGLTNIVPAPRPMLLFALVPAWIKRKRRKEIAEHHISTDNVSIASPSYTKHAAGLDVVWRTLTMTWRFRSILAHQHVLIARARSATITTFGLPVALTCEQCRTRNSRGLSVPAPSYLRAAQSSATVEREKVY